MKNVVLPNGVGKAFGNMGIKEVGQMAGAAKAQFGVAKAKIGDAAQNAFKALGNGTVSGGMGQRRKDTFSKMVSGTGLYGARKVASIKNENGKWSVYSESGKRLSEELETEEEAKKRLMAIEYLKHKNIDKNNI